VTTTPPTSPSPAAHSARPAPLRWTTPAADPVTETEAGDEEGAYEIEVKLKDGSSADVHLDKNFKVLSQESDNDKGGESESESEKDEAGDN